MSSTSSNQLENQDSSSSPLLTWERRDAIGIITLNHSARRNVLSRGMLELLLTRIRTASADRSLRCLILAAQGPAFSAGHDLAEIVDQPSDQVETLFALCSEVMEAIRLARQPVIAQVQGIATAAGCQLAATCDLVVAAEEATFATPGVKIGLFCSTPAVALSRVVPCKKALEMLFTGQAISAREAEQIGLVNRVTTRQQLAAETFALAEHIAAASSETLALGKQAFYRQLAVDRPQAYEFATAVMAENAKLSDAQEGMSAFLQKRPPHWKS